MYSSRSISSKSMTTASGGHKGMMNSYFASKGLDLSPTNSGTNRSKKISSHSIGSKAPPCKSNQKQIHPRVLESIEIYYSSRVEDLKNELIAVFQLDKGVVVSFHVYKSDNDYFELTERRRQLLYRYYNHGSQFVLLYINLEKFEHYLPVSTSALNKILQSKTVLPPSNDVCSSHKSLSKSKSMTSYIRPVRANLFRHHDSTSSTQSSNSGQSPHFVHSNREINSVCSQIQSIHVTDNQIHYSFPISSAFSKNFPQTFVHRCSKDNEEKVICRSASNS